MTIHNDIRIQSAQAYVDDFEHSFENYVDRLGGIIATHPDGPAAVKSIVQTLINAYHELGKEINAFHIPHFNTFMMFVKITGASLEHSGKNESLNILRSAIPAE